MEIAGKTALVTGASSGIGRATAKALCEAGMNVLATARSEEPLRQLASECERCRYWVGDVAQAEFAAEALARCLDAFGTCDVVVNNAGVMVAGSIDTVDIDQIAAMVRTNVEGAFRMAYTAVRHFKAQGSGHLVNTSSLLGTKVRPTAGAYAGTKYAIEALSEDFRMQLAGTGVKVTCIEPGLVMTQLHRDFPVHPKESLNIGEPLMPEDVAKTVVWVLQQPQHVLIPRLMVVPSDSPL